MIIKEFYKTRNDGVNLYKTYSDNGLMIQKVGTDEVYNEAIDIESSDFAYMETDKPIKKIKIDINKPINETKIDRSIINEFTR